MKLALITNASLGVEYRHPMPFNGSMLRHADCMFINSVVLQANRPSFDKQISTLLDKLTQCLQSNLNAKVLMPVQPYFILEIVDILLHKLDERVKIVFMSEAALPLIEYANINLEYLNPMLQNKIYHTENPLSFDKLLRSGRLSIYKDIQEYLSSHKKNHATSASDSQLFTFNEYQRELLICSHQSLRLGDSVYWLHNLNKHLASSSQLILTDPYHLDDDLFLKPFQNNLKVHYCPINPSVNFQELNHIINTLQPKHIISPYSSQAGAAAGIPSSDPLEESKVQQPSELSYPGFENAITVTHPNCVIDQVARG